jgi:hypothetical protein
MKSLEEWMPVPGALTSEVHLTEPGNCHSTFRVNLAHEKKNLNRALLQLT